MLPEAFAAMYVSSNERRRQKLDKQAARVFVSV